MIWSWWTELFDRSDERRRRRRLGMGAALGTLGAAGIILPQIFGLPEVIDPIAFPVGFVVGVTTGLGATLTLFNLRPR